MRFASALLFSIFLAPLVVHADSSPFAGNEHVTVKLISEFDHLRVPPPDQAQASSRIAVLLEIDDGWHIYWKHSGEGGSPTRVLWDESTDWKLAELRFPPPEIFSEQGGIYTYGYAKETALITDLTLKSTLSAKSKSVSVSGKVEFLVCSDICVPGQVPLTHSFTIRDEKPKPSKHAELISHYDATTAVPLDEVQTIPFFRNASLRAFHAESADGMVMGFLELENVPLPPDVTVENFIQLFAYSNEIMPVLKGEARIGANSQAILIRFGLGRKPARVENIAPLAGEILIAPSLSGAPHDVTLPWALSQTKEKMPDQSTSGSFHRLQYRLHGRGMAAPLASLPKPLPAPPVHLGLALLSAFFAGLILNLMPCVLPIISIKVLNFFSQAGQTQTEARRSASFFGLGVIASFLVLAVTIIALQKSGEAIGWGFQFQEPVFVFVLLVITFVLSLGFFDLFLFYLPFTQHANEYITSLRPSRQRDFFDGILATALSTPCTAPFLGTALAFAFSQPPGVVILVFLTIGVGLASPYVYFASHPQLLKLLPRPGAWMNRLKHFMGFALLGTSLWLIFVFESLHPDSAKWILLLLFTIHFLVWGKHEYFHGRGSKARRWLGNILLLLGISATTIGLWPRIMTPATERVAGTTAVTKIIPWENYSRELIEDARSSGRPVFIDFTAEWCITCKANERLAIEREEVARVIKANNILPLRGDWTRGDKVVGDALRSFGAYGVPLYVYFPGSNREPHIFPTLITSDMLIEVFESD